MERDFTFRVYGDMLSGNCYKVKLLMSFLEIPHEWQHVDILSGETRSEQFLSMNPVGKVPVLQISDEDFLWESNAILNYLADGTRLLPSNSLLRAHVLKWQFFEQYSHERYIAEARFINTYLGLPDDRREEYERKRPGGYRALDIMEARLRDSDFLVGPAPTVADISLYAYTHVADEGGFDMSGYEHIDRWIRRVQNIPGYIAMDRDNA